MQLFYSVSVHSFKVFIFMVFNEEERRKSFFITSSNNIKLGLVTQRPLPSRKLDRERYTMAPSIKLVRPKNS